MRRPPLRVVYVAGAGRSGSTLLARLLGQAGGFVAAGEVRYLWRRALVEGGSCSCGEDVASCVLWGPVLAAPEVAASLRRCPPPVVADRLDAQLRVRRVPAAWAGAFEAWPWDSVVPVYPALADAAGARVVVDSSKSPLYAAALARSPALDLRVVQLVRDPRATAWSWQRHKPLADGGPRRCMQTMAPWRSAALWSVWNLATDVMLSRAVPFLRVGYEDLVAAPADVVAAVLALAGERPQPGGAAAGGAVELEPAHLVAGNADRVLTGRVAIRSDDEWSSSLPRRHRMVVDSLTWPLRRRYGLAA